MRTCIVRTFRYEAGSPVAVLDKRTTYERLERRFKRKLDRRKNYCVIDGNLCETGTWTEPCSGCNEYEMGVLVSGPHGCEECGYTGKVRQSMWLPVISLDEQRRAGK